MSPNRHFRRYRKHSEASEERQQYQLFDSPQYTYRVFVTDMKDAIDLERQTGTEFSRSKRGSPIAGVGNNADWFEIVAFLHVVCGKAHLFPKHLWIILTRRVVSTVIYEGNLLRFSRSWNRRSDRKRSNHGSTLTTTRLGSCVKRAFCNQASFVLFSRPV